MLQGALMYLDSWFANCLIDCIVDAEQVNDPDQGLEDVARGRVEGDQGHQSSKQKHPNYRCHQIY